MREAWTWELTPELDAITPEPVAATARYDAEQWLGENWEALARTGVTHAQLLRDGEPVGPLLPLTRPEWASPTSSEGPAR